MKRLLIWSLPFLLVGLAYLPPAPVTGTVYNIVDFGAVAGNAGNANVNTTAVNNAIAASANPASPGVAYVPPSAGGFYVNNGQVRINTPNAVIKGEASMGANSGGGPVSKLVGKGSGHTLQVSATGCLVSGLSFGTTSNDQSGNDASILLSGAANTSVRDCCFYSPNIGISIQMPPNLDGEYWIRDILVQGKIKTAGIMANAGNSTVHVSHAIMYSDNPQPPYGICVTSCGELNINDGTDIINCGSCLAIVPGLDGTRDQHCVAISVVNSYFDGGSGAGAVLIQPTNRAYVLKATFTDVWASTAKNTTNTNGWTLDGSLSTPALPSLKSLQNVKLVGCVAKSFRDHCGVYARGVDALTITGTTIGDCFNGVQLAPGCTNFILTSNSFGNFVPPSLPTPTGGNQAFGIYLESGLGKGIVTNNVLTGNGIGGFFTQTPNNPNQVIGLNLQ